MSIFEKEVAFLRRLGKRFRTKEAYIGAIEDMYEEGLITKKALKEIKKIKGVSDQAVYKTETVKNKKTVSSHRSETIYDPCSGGSCSVRTSPC